MITTCSTTEQLPPALWSTLKIGPTWFKTTDKEFQYLDHEGSPFTHPFYDAQPLVDYNENTVNYIVVTPQDSKNSYDLDLVTGQRYKKYKYCSMDDIWERYPRQIETPPYLEGVIPRVLDSSGHPQRIIVFGSTKVTEEYIENFTHQAKIIGGVLHQYCKSPPCTQGYGWVSYPLLVGVDPAHPIYGKIKSLPELRKKVRWNYVVAFLENAYGHYKKGTHIYPSYRVIGILNPKEALLAVTTKEKTLTIEELNGLRPTCYKLYNHVWELFKPFLPGHTKEGLPFINPDKYLPPPKPQIKPVVQDEDRRSNFYINLAKRAEEKEKQKELVKKYFLNQKKKKNLRRLGVPLERFHHKFGETLQTCFQYVKASNITYNPERHWFFAYLKMLYTLPKINYFFSCSNSSWKNYDTASEKRKKDLFKKMFNGCTDYKIDQALKTFTMILKLSMKSGRPYYHYEQYNDITGGLHKKMYTWLYNPNRPINCKNPKQTSENRRDKILPDDIEWKGLKVENPGRQSVIFQ